MCEYQYISKMYKKNFFLEKVLLEVQSSKFFFQYNKKRICIYRWK